MSNGGLTDKEIALVKAMQERGKSSGFTAQKILAYFSRPERTINVARLYEIRDGTRGEHVQVASEDDLYQFLLRFDLTARSREGREPSLKYRPVPAYLGIYEGRVSLIARGVDDDDERVTLRQRLISEQRRLANILAQDWSRFQVDQHTWKATPPLRPSLIGH